MERFFWTCVLAGVMLAAIVSPTLAQTPEPTLEPTPVYQSSYALSSGDTLIVERRITYGDIAVVIGLGLLIVTILIYALIRIPRLWLR